MVAELNRCPDAYYRWSLYDLACIIVDYPDQVGHTCVVQGWCPMCVRAFTNLNANAIVACQCTNLKRVCSCTAKPSEEYDMSKAVYRTTEHTELLIKAYPDVGERGMLWKEYGIIGSVVVSCFFPQHIDG